ncbi:MAG: peptidylprolyl isomerase [Deltaproteobacteria bacterium]|nr:peptidylprolyl isomerase [Deltaproteobacteria bacterium]
MSPGSIPSRSVYRGSRLGAAAATLLSSVLSSLLVVAALCATPVAAPRAARAEVVERVVAIVNEQAIFQSDVEQQVRRFLSQLDRAPSPEVRAQALARLRREVLDHLIEEILVQQAASRMEVSVGAADVERAINNVIRQSGLSSARFWQVVRQQGYTVREYRNDVRRQLLRLKVLNVRVRGRVNITPEDVRDFYNRSVREARASDTFRASHILLRLPAGAGAAEVARVRTRARGLAMEVRGGRPFADVARESSQDDATRERGGDLGELRRGQLPRTIDEAMLALDVGEVSDPVRSEHGFHVLTVTHREQTDVQPYAAVRQQIYRQMLEREMVRQERLWLGELRRAAHIEIVGRTRRAASAD